MPATNRTQRSARMVRVAAFAGVVRILGAFGLAARSREQTKPAPAKSTITAPPLCVVGTPGCGPLPMLPTQHTPIPQDAPRGPLRPGLLRPGTYNTPGWNTVGFHLVFTVPNGWNWDGQALTKGNAAVYFSTGPVRVYADPCHWARPQPKHAPWNHVLVEDALAAQPMRHATRPKVIWSSLAVPSRRFWSPVEVRLTVPSNMIRRLRSRPVPNLADRANHSIPTRPRPARPDRDRISRRPPAPHRRRHVPQHTPPSCPPGRCHPRLGQDR